jgi:hypothetical protein
MQAPPIIEQCQKCNSSEGDLRTLYMSCFYQMHELNLPFLETPEGDYTLRVCKNCRGDWMKAIKDWFHAPIIENENGDGIYIRKYGKLIELSEEKFQMHMYNEQFNKLFEGRDKK